MSYQKEQRHREELATLKRCGIPLADLGDGVVGGKLGPFTIRRSHSYYWAVEGKMPLAVARELYAHPVGVTDIRVAGHCGCPAPDEWVHHYATDGVELVSDPDGKQARQCEHFTKTIPGFAEEMRKKPLRFVPDAAAVSVTSFVESYHIDSELGLYVFVEMVRRRNLAD